MEQQFDFEQLGKALSEVNNAIGIVTNASTLLGSSQEKALKLISTLAQLCQNLEAEIEEKDNRINELEAMLEAKDVKNG